MPIRIKEKSEKINLWNKKLEIENSNFLHALESFNNRKNSWIQIFTILVTLSLFGWGYLLSLSLNYKSKIVLGVILFVPLLFSIIYYKKNYSVKKSPKKRRFLQIDYLMELFKRLDEDWFIEPILYDYELDYYSSRNYESFQIKAEGLEKELKRQRESEKKNLIEKYKSKFLSNLSSKKNLGKVKLTTFMEPLGFVKYNDIVINQYKIMDKQGNSFLAVIKGNKELIVSYTTGIVELVGKFSDLTDQEKKLLFLERFAENDKLFRIKEYKILEKLVHKRPKYVKFN